MRPETFIIVNPAAGRGKTGQRWAGIEERLRIEGAQFDAEFTHEPGHATLLARDAVATGYRTIVSVGGDGTLNEVVNGLIANGRVDPDVRLASSPAEPAQTLVEASACRATRSSRRCTCSKQNHAGSTRGKSSASWARE